MEKILLYVVVLAAAVTLAACGGDKSRAERDKEVQRAIQEGAQKERKMYEGMQKGVEELEKNIEQKAK